MQRRNFIRQSAFGAMGSAILPLYTGGQGGASLVKKAAVFSGHAKYSMQSLDWVHDALVVAMPAAAVGGCKAGIYTAAENGVKPWRQAIIRWLTSKSVQGNGAVLVRQEGLEGGAGLTAIIDPNADYHFEVLVHVPGGIFFGDAQDKNLPVWIAVMDMNDRVIAEEQVKINWGDWASAQVSFSSGTLRKVRCVVQARSPQSLPCLYFVEGFRLTRKDHAWWNPQNLFCSSRTTVLLNDERKLLIETLDPDLVGGHNGVYLNWDGFFTKQGIAVGGGHWEQEYNHLSVDDPMVEPFREDGMVRELDGKIVTTSKLWPGYHMCHNAPGWHSYYKKRLTRVAPEVHLISQDNICSASFMSWGKNGCFCRWCRTGFREWLRQHWAPGQFSAAGIGDPDNLDIVDYVNRVKVNTVSKGAEAVLADPVLRAYVQFSYISQSDRWRDSVEAVKKAAGHPVAVCGNQWGSNGIRPYSTVLSQISDVICTETGIGGGTYTTTLRAWNALATKASFAAGEYRRPVWLYLSSLFHTSQAARSYLQMANSQAWSDGGVPMPWATAAGSGGWFYDTEAGMCRFVQKNRALFARRENCANVGLVYSLPTHAWREFTAFGLSSEKYRKWYVALAQLLEEMHIPYEVNCWWHPLLGDEKASMERLSKYKVLILPGVDCFSDDQREAVRKFQAGGGRVVHLSCPKLYNEDVLPRHSDQTLAVSGKTLFEIKPELLENYISENSSPVSENEGKRKKAAGKLQSVIIAALAGDGMLKTDAHAGVWSNVWLDNTGKVLSLHMVNGNIDEGNDQFHIVEGSRWSVRLPEGLAVTEALFISPDESAKSEIIPVEVKRGWATVVVPRVESYSVVALYAGDALTKAERAAKARRAEWMAFVANQSAGNF
jgi:hypothetical protein